MIMVKFTYEHNNDYLEDSFYIPNSILKLATYQSTSPYQFDKLFSSARKLKSEEFILSRYISPESLKKWIPSLKEATSYTDFAQPGS